MTKEKLGAYPKSITKNINHNICHFGQNIILNMDHLLKILFIINIYLTKTRVQTLVTCQYIYVMNNIFGQ